MEPEKFHLEVANPRDLRVLQIIQVGMEKLKGITNLDDAGGIFSSTCDAIALLSEDGVKILSSSVVEVSEAWAREFPDSDEDISMSEETAAAKMASLFNFDGKDKIEGDEEDLGLFLSASDVKDDAIVKT